MKSIKLTKLEIVFLSFIILLGTFFRLYRIQDTAMFLGDQGRDAMIARDILKEGDIALIGPVTSVGNMYLGPLYYYFMVPWLALTYPNPIGPAIGIAIVSIITIPLVYFIIRKMYDRLTAIFASTLVTTSSIITAQSRFSWNPNLAPIFGLLAYYFMYLFIKEKKSKNIIWATICFSILLQLHYMAATVGIILALLVIIQLIKQKKNRTTIIKHSLISIVIFLFSISPLVVFDLRHGGTNLNSFTQFITSSEEHIRPANKIVSILQDMNGNAQKLTTQMFGSKTYILDQIGVVMILVFSIFLYLNKKNKEANWILLFWNLVTIGVISLYSSSIFTHYVSFTYIISAIYFAVLLGFLFKHKNLLLKFLSIAMLFTISINESIHSPAFAKSRGDIKHSQKVSQTIYDRVGNSEKYNIVLISGTGDIDGQNYRYFLETTDKPPVKKENRGEVESLYIIQEDYFDTNPVDSPIYEIVVFHDKTPKEVYTIDNGPTITVLKANNEE